MLLRTWQAECIELALARFGAGHKHTFVMATPGGGKTTMAAILCKTLFERNAIDLVVCFTPTTAVCLSFKEELELRMSEPFDGRLGARGQVITYQALSYLNADFWRRFDHLKILIIFDEAHHCGGDTSETATAWGDIILREIRDRATYTLSLSGTPWRTDQSPVTLAAYCSQQHKLQPDYVYGIQSAINDRVCRHPRITAIDNNAITLDEDGATRSYNCIAQLLENETLPYQNLLESEPLVLYILQQAITKLDEVRRFNPNAGGLIVTSSVRHARFIERIMSTSLNEDSLVITHHDPRAHLSLKQYRASTKKWVISVGMISEGTNIPRLQVCCHLSNIKTELHFRQVLGRIMRVTSDDRHPFAYLFILAEKKLVEFAQHLAADLPNESGMLRIEDTSSTYPASMPPQPPQINKSDKDLNVSTVLINTLLSQPPIGGSEESKSGNVSTAIEPTMFGRFLKQLVEIENMWSSTS
ncbi:DEAD/DEAH box helicase [Agaribacterium sp. ZY112]|uniref:DEAD/DEAH box helicase n=1 Tax=Agaribacterium sp. ZY112 TaxID=3233574 RepID=UPI00352618FF